MVPFQGFFTSTGLASKVHPSKNQIIMKDFSATLRCDTWTWLGACTTILDVKAVGTHAISFNFRSTFQLLCAAV